MPESTTVILYIDAESGGEPIRRKDIQTLFTSAQALLEEIEEEITGAPPQAEWRWAEDYHLPLTASVNGVDAATLNRIAVTAHEVFEQARREGRKVQWPQEFTERAKRSVQNMLRVLKRIEAIEVTSNGRVTRIESAEISETVGRQRVRRVLSTVEGHLSTLSDRGTYIYGRLIEHGTGAHVWCHFPNEFADDISGLFRHHRVIVLGYVTYDDKGHPTSVTHVEQVRERERSEPLPSFIGVAPSITGGRTVEDFIQVMRDDD